MLQLKQGVSMEDGANMTATYLDVRLLIFPVVVSYCFASAKIDAMPITVSPNGFSVQPAQLGLSVATDQLQNRSRERPMRA